MTATGFVGLQMPNDDLDNIIEAFENFPCTSNMMILQLLKELRVAREVVDDARAARSYCDYTSVATDLDNSLKAYDETINK